MKSIGQKSSGARLERMQNSPLWFEGRFKNIYPILPGLRDPHVSMPKLTEFLFDRNGRLPRHPLPSMDPRDVWNQRPDSGLRATWLGHSTVLIEIDGMRVLTDPVWGQHASPVNGLGPKRFQPVPVPVHQMSELDVVVISHDHYDHLDYPTIRELAKLDVPFVTSLGVGAHLELWSVKPERIIELDWWESYTLPKNGLTLTAAPSQHFSGRGLNDRNKTLWSSFVFRSNKHSVFFSGDTGLTEEYTVIRDRLGPFDLIMLEIGGQHPAWGDIHLGPHNALRALSFLGRAPFMPIHWGTFSLALHPWDEPAEMLFELGTKAGIQLVMPQLGVPVEPSQVEHVDPWWREVDKIP